LQLILECKIMISVTVDLNQVRGGRSSSEYEMSDSQILLWFADRFEEANVKVTMFASADFFDHCDCVKELAENPMVQFGGQNMRSHVPMEWGRLWKENPNGGAYSQDFQRWVVNQTKNLIFEKTGQQITSWRNCGSSVLPVVDEVLAPNGIQVCADSNGHEGQGHWWSSTGVLTLPVNVQMESRVYDSISNQSRWQSNCESFGFYEDATDQVVEELIKEMIRNEIRGVHSSVLIDPIMMYRHDQFESLQSRLIEFLVYEDTFHLSDVIAHEWKRIHYGNRNN